MCGSVNVEYELKLGLVMVWSSAIISWIFFVFLISCIEYNPQPEPGLPLNMEVYVTDSVLLSEFIHSGAIMELTIKCKYKDVATCKESLKHVKNYLKGNAFRDSVRSRL